MIPSSLLTLLSAVVLILFSATATSTASSSSSTTTTTDNTKKLLYDEKIESKMSSPSSPSSLPCNNNNNNRQQYAVFSDIDGTLVHYPVNLQHVSDDDDGDALQKSVGSNNDEYGSSLLYLPPSKTGTRGVISTRTLQLCHRLRHHHHNGISNSQGSSGDNDDVTTPFILVSGMRTTTLFQRLPYLPRADAYVSESGGRIFYPRSISSKEKKIIEEDDDDDGLVKDLIIQPISYTGISTNDEIPFILVEDMDWRKRMSQLDAAGIDGYNSDDYTIPIQQRRGKLWEFASTLIKQGYILDTSGYATSYRINRKHQTTDLSSLSFDDFLAKCSKKDGDDGSSSIIPKGLDCSTNLGCVDIYPNMSGKKNCAEYLVQRFLQQPQQMQHTGSSSSDTQQEQQQHHHQPSIISLKTNAYCLCDDDNDVEMALACKAAYLPSVTSESIRKLVHQLQDSSSSSGGSSDNEVLDGKLVVTEDASNGIVETLATEAALEAIIKKLQS